MRDHVLEEVLRPAGNTEIRRPARQLSVGHFGCEIGQLGAAIGTCNYDATVDSRGSLGSRYYTAVYMRQAGDWELPIWHPTVT